MLHFISVSWYKECSGSIDNAVMPSNASDVISVFWYKECSGSIDNTSQVMCVMAQSPIAQLIHGSHTD